MSSLENAIERKAAGQAASIAAELVSGGSLEMGAHRPQDARGIAAHLPGGTPVYVNHLPRHRLLDTLPTLVAVRKAGLEPVPHIAARRIKDRAELQSFLERAVGDAGVRKALILGGDEAEAAGPYPDGAALMREGLLASAGLKEIGLPGYPEGHPRIPSATLEGAFHEKLAIAAAQGLGSYVVTQFSFAPARVVEYCSGLARSAPSIPVYVGLAGPTNPVALLRFAQRCGVSASLRALRTQGMDAVRLVTHTDPEEQLSALARYCAAHADCNVVGVHLFTFGGVNSAAAWMNRYIASLGNPA
ncbi:MAG: methylenetetrahydrofolate reductase [Candidatus Parcubacteria bacterium]|nr:methylenetetrahydrofolate reductase [Burkholderiales bacterium]